MVVRVVCDGNDSYLTPTDIKNLLKIDPATARKTSPENWLADDAQKQLLFTAVENKSITSYPDEPTADRASAQQLMSGK